MVIAEAFNRCSKLGGVARISRFHQSLGGNLPTLTNDGLYYRVGIAIGQIIQTPDNLGRSDFIEDDVPYEGALTLQTAWYAFNDSEFRGFEVTAGVVGPLSLAKQVQMAGHKLFDGNEPNGWDNQLDNEPVVNLNYMRKHKIWRQGNQSGQRRVRAARWSQHAARLRVCARPHGLKHALYGFPETSQSWGGILLRYLGVVW